MNFTTSDNIRQFKARGGVGCTTRSDCNMVNSPPPSTERGKRRHAKRNVEQKKIAENSWNKPRTAKPSRYQRALGTANRS